ncbi:uncharacterized protein LOC5567268 [Aedes aegypti]|uniref:Uncharacterized protein n=1 Tax=Aedes aegypti TaxID=7159 RepID=A0A6I8TC68_AEDAE|nr:uncharacterized protein LOC5567268 [Aedes aegypti]
MPNIIQDHPIGKQKRLAKKFTKFQVLSIIKQFTMDKMKESAAGESGVGGGGGTVGTMGSDEFHSEFYNTGRIGRRNALPDILGSHCTTTTADLPTQMGALSTSDCSNKPVNASSAVSTNNMMANTPTTSTTGSGS